MSTVSQNIRAARVHAGLRRETLAERIGYSANTLAQWEQGKIAPKVDAVEAIADALGVHPSELCGWGLPQPKPEPKPGLAELRERLSQLSYKANAEQLELTARFLRAMIGPPR